jgi:putative membrane protein
MFRALLNWIASAISLLIVANIVPGFMVASFTAALIAALVIGFINATLGFVIKVLTLPLSIITLGVFWFVINAVMLLVASAFVPGFKIAGFIPAFIGAVVLSIVNMILHWFVKEVVSDSKND